MKKAICILLALVMMLSAGITAAAAEEWTCPSCGETAGGNFCSNCGSPKPPVETLPAEQVSGGGEELPDGPVTARLSVSINRPILPLIGAALENTVSGASEIVTAAANIIEQLVIQGTWDGTDAQLDVVLNGENLAYAAIRSADDLVTVVSDMLPDGTVIQGTVKELMRAAGIYYGERELNLSYTPEDLRMLENTVKTMIRKIDDRIAAWTDTEEQGSWVFEGITFTSRRRINATSREIGIIALKTLRETIQDPEITALLARAGVEPRNLDLDWQIENQEKASDEYYLMLDAYRYSNPDGDVFNDGTLQMFETVYHYDPETWEETYTREPTDKIIVQYGNLNRSIFARLVRPGAAEAVLKASSDGSAYDFRFSANGIYTGGIYVGGKLQVSGKTAPNGDREGSLAVQFSGMDLLALNYTISRSRGVSASFDTAGRQVLSVRDLGSSSFYSGIRSKLLEAAGRMCTIMPDDFAKLLSVVPNLINR